MEWDVRFDLDCGRGLRDWPKRCRMKSLPSSSYCGSVVRNSVAPMSILWKVPRFTNMKELRVQFKGEPWRILFAFDPDRAAILLVGGNKRGDKRWYKKHLPIADERFRRHLERLEQ